LSDDKVMCRLLKHHSTHHEHFHPRIVQSKHLRLETGRRLISRQLINTETNKYFLQDGTGQPVISPSSCLVFYQNEPSMPLPKRTLPHTWPELQELQAFVP
jgi:hypothetical protein